MKHSIKHMIPSYVENVISAENPVFRTCEVLTRIDNLLAGRKGRPLGSAEKIQILRALRKGLELKMKATFQISGRQADPNRSILELVDRKIDHYKVVLAQTPPPPRIYDRKRA